MDISTGRWRAGSVSWGWGKKMQIREGNSSARQAAAERQPRGFPVPAEPLGSDWVQLEPSVATQLAEVGVQKEPRVMNQDKPISKA